MTISQALCGSDNLLIIVPLSSVLSHTSILIVSASSISTQYGSRDDAFAASDRLDKFISLCIFELLLVRGEKP